MNMELERYKDALDVAMRGLRSVGQGNPPSWVRTEAYECLARIEMTLNPPPEMETVEKTVYLNTYSHGEYYGYDTKEKADKASSDERIDCQEITIKVQRPKPQPIERSAVVLFKATPSSEYQHVSGDIMPNSQYEAVVTWVDPPK